MEPTEKGIVIEKVMEMPEKQVEKVLIFIAGLEAGSRMEEVLFVLQGKEEKGVSEEL